MKNVGIALGGGGVRGFAHAPALEAIEDAGIRPAAIAGTSIGAIIGALYASGKSGREIREFLDRYFVSREDPWSDLYRKRSDLLKWFGAIRPSWDNSGLLSADRFLDYLLPDFRDARFEDLEIPLQVVATDFYRGEPVVFRSGDLMPALRASMSIPGIFVPVQQGDRILVDGGVVNNLPYDLLADDCDSTFALEIRPLRESQGDEIPNLVDLTLGAFDLMLERMTAEKLSRSPPTVHVTFEFHGIRTLDFGKVDRVWEQSRGGIEDLRGKLATLVAGT